MDHLLFECISGYALFKVIKQDPLTGCSFDDINILKGSLSLITFHKFENFDSALENFTTLSKNQLPNDLKNLLKNKNIKKLYCDKSLCILLKDLGIETDQCDNLMRGVKLNEKKILKTDENYLLGAAHKFSRSKIENSDKKEDILIIQTVLTLEQVRNDYNFFILKVKNQFDFYFPELKEIVENENFLKIAKSFTTYDAKTALKNIKKEFGREFRDKVKDTIKFSIGKIGNKKEEVLKTSDFLNLSQTISITYEKLELIKELNEYLEKKLSFIAPNLLILLGPFLTGKMIAQAGSLLNLAKCPSSTVQLLGAESALFRALKKKSNTPKYGIICEADEVLKSVNRGKLSRQLATKISVAAKVDYFREDRSNEIGKKLKEIVNENLKGNKINTAEALLEIQ